MVVNTETPDTVATVIATIASGHRDAKTHDIVVLTPSTHHYSVSKKDY